MTVALPNLQRTMERWNAPSTWLILAMGIGFFGPAFYDSQVVEKPWVSTTLEIVDNATFGIIIKDNITTTTDVVGERLMWVEDESGTRVCHHSRHDGWNATDLRIWSIEAFFEGECVRPTVPFRVCSRFVVETDFGSHGRFGPYCSNYFKDDVA